MASTEEELKDELTKLEIAPTLSQVKLLNDGNLPITLNPFYDIKNVDNDAAALAAVRPYMPLHQQHGQALANCRRCRLRRRSESVLDDYKASAKANEVEHANASVGPGASHGRSGMPRLQRLPLKKTSPSGAGGGTSGAGNGRRLIVREPVLRALQTCFHPQSGARRRLLGLADVAGGDASNVTRQSTDASAGRTCQQEAQTKCQGMPAGSAPHASRQPARAISDFRDLIDECQTLLQQDVEFSRRLNHLSQSPKTLKSFTTLRAPAAGVKQRTTSLSSEALMGAGAAGDSQRPSSLAAHSSGLRDYNGLAVAMAAAAAAASQRPASTSCSQQAGNGCAHVGPVGVVGAVPGSSMASTSATAVAMAGSAAAASGAGGGACDDVTIDELASYFDTFVHIPKKMSTMAEMMYI